MMPRTPPGGRNICANVSMGNNCKNCTDLDDTGPMVACDVCGDWFHQRCVGVSRKIKDHRWVCERCITSMQAAQKKTRAAASQTHTSHNTQRRNSSQSVQGQSHTPHQEQRPRASSVREKVQSVSTQQAHTSCALSFHNLPQQGQSQANQTQRAVSKNSRISHRSNTSSKLAALELQRVDEERVLKEQLNKEYLDRRFGVLQRIAMQDDSQSESSADEVDEDCEDVAQERISQWIQQGATVGEVQIQGPMVSQIDAAQNVSALPIVYTAVPNAHAPQLACIKQCTPKNSPSRCSYQQPLLQEPQMTRPRSNEICVTNNQAQVAPPASNALLNVLLSSDQIAARHVMPRELPLLYGHPEEWPLFYSSFESTTRICGYTNDENLVRLQRCLKGKALEAVRSRLLLPSNVPSIISTLRMLYGRPELILNSLLQKVRSEPSPKSEKLETIIHFSLSVQNLCATMESTGLIDHLNNPMILQELTDKLPCQIKVNWAVHRQNLTAPNLLSFNDWLTQLAQSISEVSLNVTTANDQKQDGTKRKNFVNTHSERSVQEQLDSPRASENRKCCICQQSCSTVKDCRQFGELAINDRWNAVRQYKLCRTCLSTHGRGRCRSNVVCGMNGCRYKHHSLLHNTIPNFNIHEVNTASVNESICNIHRSKNQSILFHIVPVVLYGKNQKIETFAFLDEGSSLTLIDQELAIQLDLKGSSEPLCLKWTANTHRTEEESQLVSFKISGLQIQTMHSISNAHTVKSLNLPAQTLSVASLMEKHSYLRGLPIEAYENAVPRLLIGLDNWKLGMTLKFREGKENEPIAAKTRLGWSIYGPMENDNRDDAFQRQQFQGFHMCECQHANDNILQQMVKDYFSLDSFGVVKPCKTLLSVEDERSMQILEETTTKVGDRFETGLLWKHDNINLPNSLPMAMNRFCCLEKKMSSKPDFAIALKEKIGEYLTKGYIHKLSKAELDLQLPRIWYLPIFTVSNVNKPGKFRIVWDAAAKARGVSLNSMLMKGPDQLTSLPTVLYQFRQKQIAICADIREMFHQVRIRYDDRHSQRFLWRNDPDDEVDTYQMNVMTFGASCSPSSAQFVKNKNARGFAEQFPRAVNAILHKHYVDDYLDSVDTEEEAVQLAREVTFIHSQGGFEIRNWISNSKIVIDTLGEDSEKDKKCFDSDVELGVEKVLGMWWSTTNDTFSFVLSCDKSNEEILSGHRRPTKRQVLRIMMKIFDPLGLIANFIVFIKILLQDIWRSSIDWDDAITDSQNEKWLRWVNLLPKIQAISIPRCYLKNEKFAEEDDHQLHIFVDASENAFAAVAYLRMAKGGNVQCSLIGAKTRVAPIKLLSIPRLELQAAVLGARFAKSIQEQHSIHFKKRFFWSDARPVISWINSDHRTYKQFVAFRIGELLDLSEANEWRWVPTKENVADEATKWQKLPDLSEDGRWYNGPKFLRMSEDEWPKSPPLLTSTAEEEIRVHMLHSYTNRSSLFEVNRFSSWEKLLRTAVYVMRAVTNILSKPNIVIRGPFTSEEYQEAENVIYRQAQTEEFMEEVAALTRNVPVKKTSAIYKQTPYLDDNGVIRSRGRIDAAPNVPVATKRPILLPKRHRITRLVVEAFHKRYHHHNSETVVNELRQIYSIPQLRGLLKSVRKSCAVCRIRDATPSPPQMSELPAARLATFTRPFTFVGIDYFGPITVAIGRRSEKRWGMLVTCLTTRAIHIEVAHTLSTDSCLLCLRNFIARRGIPNEIYCDNGTNFHGVENELRKALSAIKSTDLASELRSTTIKWKFNPPASPHMGGSWERLVRSIKTTLYAIMPNRNPSDELLKSMLIEVENVVNSRPLTYMPIDEIHQEAITPNHFLIGSSNGSKPIGEFSDDKHILRKNWMTAQYYANTFWKRWVKEYLPTLTRRTKWFEPAKPIEPGDIVIIVDDKFPRNTWPKGRVLDVKIGKDGQVRRATVQTATGVFERPAVKLAVLDIRDRSEGISIIDESLIPGGSVNNTDDTRPQANAIPAQ